MAREGRDLQTAAKATQIDHKHNIISAVERLITSKISFHVIYVCVVYRPAHYVYAIYTHAVYILKIFTCRPIYLYNLYDI